MRVTRARTKLSPMVALATAATMLAGGSARAHPHVWVTTQTTVLYENGTIVGLRQKWSFDDFYSSMALQGLDTNNDGVYDRSELAELAKVNIDGLKEFDYFTTAMLAAMKLKFGAPTDFYLEHAEGPAGQSQVIDMTDEEMDKQVAAEEAAKAPPSEPGMMSRLWNWAFGAPATQGPAADSKAKSATPPPPTKVLSLHFTLPLAQPVLAEAEGFSFTIVDPSFFIALEPAAKDAAVLGPGAPATCRLLTGEAARQAVAPQPPQQPQQQAATPGTTPPAGAAQPAEPNPAADLNRLSESFVQQFGSGSVNMGMGKPVSISCGPRS